MVNPPQTEYLVFHFGVEKAQIKPEFDSIEGLLQQK